MNPKLYGDVDGDGIITGHDLELVIRSAGKSKYDKWGFGEGQYNLDADLNLDGVINYDEVKYVRDNICSSSPYMILNRDPLIWYRSVGTPESKSWGGWVQHHPRDYPFVSGGGEPEVFDGEFSFLKPGAYGRLKLYYPTIKVGIFDTTVPKGMGQICLIQGRRPPFWTYVHGVPSYGGWQFLEVPISSNLADNCEADLTFEVNILEHGFWVSTILDIWGRFSSAIEVDTGPPPLGEGLIVTDTFELVYYAYVEGDWFAELINKGFLTLGIALPGEGKGGKHRWLMYRYFESDSAPEGKVTWHMSLRNLLRPIYEIATNAGVMAYITGIEPLTEVMNAHAETTFYNFFFYIPRVLSF